MLRQRPALYVMHPPCSLCEAPSVIVVHRDSNEQVGMCQNGHAVVRDMTGRVVFEKEVKK